MTEDDRAFFKRRMHEELQQAARVDDAELENLHLRCARAYRARLDGKPASEVRLIAQGLVPLHEKESAALTEA